MGGSVGKSDSSSNNSFNTDVWKPQGDALQGLYDKVLGQLGGNNFGDQIAGAAGNVSGKFDELFGTANDANKDLANGGVYGDTSAIMDKLMGMMGGRTNTGSMYESIIGGSGNTYIDPLVAQMRDSTKQNIDTFKGGNALDAAAMGQSGSSRQAMNDAMFSSQANKDFSNQEAALRAGAYDKDLEMKMNIAGMADNNMQKEQDRLMGMLQGAQGGKENVSSNSNSLMQTILTGGMNPWLAAQQGMWNPFVNAGNIIGKPTLTGSGSGSSSSKGFGTGGSLWG